MRSYMELVNLEWLKHPLLGGCVGSIVTLIVTSSCRKFNTFWRKPILSVVSCEGIFTDINSSNEPAYVQFLSIKNSGKSLAEDVTVQIDKVIGLKPRNLSSILKEDGDLLETVILQIGTIPPNVTKRIPFARIKIRAYNNLKGLLIHGAEERSMPCKPEEWQCLMEFQCTSNVSFEADIFSNAHLRYEGFVCQRGYSSQNLAIVDTKFKAHEV